MNIDEAATIARPAQAPYRDYLSLTWQLSRRELEAKYRGSIGGLIWMIAGPLLLMVIYTFVFGYVLQLRWASAGVTVCSKAGAGVEFATILFAGLSSFNFFAECVSRAPGLVVANPSLVKRVRFPSEILALSAIQVATIGLLVNLGVLLVLQVILCGALSTTLFLLPLALMPLVLFTLGITWVFAAVGVYFRDINHVVVPITTALMFSAPVIYPLDSVPAHLRSVLEWNPLTTPIEQIRNVLAKGVWLDWEAFLTSLVVGTLIAALGLWFFTKMKRGFGDVV